MPHEELFCREFEALLNGVYELVRTEDHNAVNFYQRNDTSASPEGVFLSKELVDFGQNPNFGSWNLHLRPPRDRNSDDAIAFALDNSDDAGKVLL